MNYLIYKITNKLDGKFYIGKHQTKDVNDKYFGSGKLLKRAIKKHGIENFTKEILHIFDNEKDMNDKEKELVILCEKSYNLCEGGKGGFGHINRNGLNTNIHTINKNGLNNKAQQYAIVGKRLKKDKEFAKVFSKSVSKGLKEYYQENPGHNGFLGKKHSHNGFLGKKHSEKYKTKMSVIMSQKHSGKNNPNFGKFWITNGQENKMTKSDIPEGWYRGRV